LEKGDLGGFKKQQGEEIFGKRYNYPKFLIIVDMMGMTPGAFWAGGF
jgi:hypothetical protein